MQQRRVFDKNVIKTINGFADDNVNVGEFTKWISGQCVEDQVEILVGLLNYGRKYNEDTAYDIALNDACVPKEGIAILNESKMLADGKIMHFDGQRLGAFKDNIEALNCALVAGFLYYGRNDNRKKFYPNFAPEPKQMSFWQRIFG